MSKTFAGLLILVGGVIGCNRAAPDAQKPAASQPGAPTIAIVHPEKKELRRTVEQPGIIAATEETRLFAKLPGFVSLIAVDPKKAAAGEADPRVDIGSRVAAGQVLAELAIPEMERESKQKAALVKEAEAQIELSKKGLAAAEAGVASSKAMVSEAKAGLERGQALYDRWRSESDRIAGLVKGGVIDQQSRDETNYQFRAAEATRNEAVAKLASANADVQRSEAARAKAVADVVAAEAKLDVAKAEAARVMALLGYTKIAAPYDGVVTQRSINTGDFLAGGGKEGVFAVARLHPVRIVTHVPEVDAGLVQPGLAVRIAVQALPGEEFTGKIARTSWSLEPGSRTLRVEVDLPNKEDRLRPGMYVYARIVVPMPENWTAPAAAIGKAADDSIMYFADDGKARRVQVQVARGDGKLTQVLRYKKTAEAGWSEFTGAESIATPAAALSDGQAIPSK